MLTSAVTVKTAHLDGTGEKCSVAITNNARKPGQRVLYAKATGEDTTLHLTEAITMSKTFGEFYLIKSTNFRSTDPARTLLEIQAAVFLRLQCVLGVPSTLRYVHHMKSKENHCYTLINTKQTTQ